MATSASLRAMSRLRLPSAPAAAATSSILARRPGLVIRAFPHLSPSAPLAARHAVSIRQYSSSQARPTPRASERGDEADSNPEPEPESDTPPNASAYARFKALSKKYGWYALGMYTFLSSIDFSLAFLAVHAAGAERIEPVFKAGVRQYRVLRHGEAGADELEREGREAAGKAEREEAARRERGEVQESSRWKGYGSKALWAEIALAYAIHKTALLPLRAGLTVAWTPKFVGWLASRGWVGKGGMTRAASHAGGKIRTASGKVREKVKDMRD